MIVVCNFVDNFSFAGPRLWHIMLFFSLFAMLQFFLNVPIMLSWVLHCLGCLIYYAFKYNFADPTELVRPSLCCFSDVLDGVSGESYLSWDQFHTILSCNYYGTYMIQLIILCVDKNKTNNFLKFCITWKRMLSL